MRKWRRNTYRYEWLLQTKVDEATKPTHHPPRG
ncbi:uncharacterized protein G2W53_003716 [Senna tora]|uniref:Uncharacterized protein n=1 Tax=Senna tora TaxID=362788 RepID=A0A834X964_9FABA|nr:uncharacterized protein G2W53_003716 [Senna tora]